MATAWAVPRTWVTAEVVTSGEMNTDIRDNATWLGTDKPMCRVYNAADITCADVTATLLTFTAERYDNQGLHDTVTNTGRLTVPAGMGGKYLVGGGLKWAASTAGDERQLAILVNGATTIATDSKPPGGTNGNCRHNAAAMYALAAGDYVTLVGTQNSGGPLNALGATLAGNYSLEFWALWMSN